MSQTQYITLAREKKVRVFEENQALAKNPLFLLVDEKNEKLYIVIDAEKWFFGQRYFGA